VTFGRFGLPRGLYLSQNFRLVFAYCRSGPVVKRSGRTQLSAGQRAKRDPFGAESGK
jgi:hypothetical protein